jgi:pectin methylesterase-like acyl-CoA thioesterase|tara:strand:- start:19 stop:432 length:414 start_codon:yes stop_codon:yes gene_type:complete
MKDEWKLFIGWLAIVILLLLSGCASVAPNEKWSDESITLGTTLTSLSVIDARQTFHMEEYRMYYDKLEPITYAHEANPLIGESPTQDRVVMVKVLSGALMYFGLNKMKEKNRKKALIYLNVFYFIVVLHNASLGLMS